MNKIAAWFIGAILGLTVVGLIFIPLFLYSAWAGAFVGVKLWAWFVVPVFGFKAVTLPQAFGLSLLIGYWTKQHFNNHAKDERDVTTKAVEFCSLLAYPWLVLLFGFICKSYWM